MVRSRLPDMVLLSIVLVLAGFGAIMIFSASSVEALRNYGSPYHFLDRQLIWLVLGGVLMLVAARYDYWKLKRFAWPLAWVTLILLVAVLVPHVGREIGGARRWIGFGSFLLQPSELAKFSLVLLFAHTLTREKLELTRTTKTLLPHLFMLGVAGALIMKEPDLGTTMSLAATAVVMLWVAGTPTLQVGLTALSALPAVGAMIIIAPYRLRRFMAFLHPQQDPLGAGYHIIQSLYAIGSGGLFGEGLGRSSLKYFYLPEQHTDFIFSILSEELGFFGAVGVLVLFFALGWRGYKASLQAPDRFGALLGTGLTTMILVQALLNIAVVTASVPITGIPLPFISYGGSSLVFAMMGVGILLNISRYGKRERI